MGVNSAYRLAGPTTDWCFPWFLPEGEYYRCMKVDSDEQISKTSETDNVLRSEKKFLITN